MNKVEGRTAGTENGKQRRGRSRKREKGLDVRKMSSKNCKNRSGLISQIEGNIFFNLISKHCETETVVSI